MMLWALWLGCRPAPVRPDVVLITLDTTRADRIGAWGHAEARTPVLDGLAARGRRYERVLSPIPLTIPAHASLFTGRYPPRLGIRANGDAPLGPGLVTLTDRLHDAGWRTGASVGAFVTGRAWGFQQGFDQFSDSVDAVDGPWHAERPGAEVVDDILAWEAATRAAPEPRFAWVHLYDAHFPHEGGYDAEIARVDEQVGRVLEAFDRRPTLVAVVGDHGESLGDHGELLHGWYPYEATQRVPWILAGPGVRADVVSEPVSLVDVAPTLLDLVGVEALPDPDGEPVPAGRERVLYAESWQLTQRFGLAPPTAVVQGRYKLVALPRAELYDVVADPNELDDLAAQQPDRVDAMTLALHALGFAAPHSDPGRRPDPDLVQRLTALGYVEPSGAVPAAPLPDPKDHGDLLMASQGIDRQVAQGRWADAERSLATLAAAYPDVPELLQRRAWVLTRLGRPAEATPLVEEALARAPDDATLRVALASQLAGQGDYRRAAELYQEAAEVLPWATGLRPMTLRAWLDAGDAVVASELGAAWLEQTPNDAAVAGLVGIALLQQRRVEPALPLLELGATAAVPERGVLFHLSAAAAGRGRGAEARRLLEEELRHHPASVPAVAALVNVLIAADELDAARGVTSAALLRRAEDPDLLGLHARVLAVSRRWDEARVALDLALVRSRTSDLLLLDAELLDHEGQTDVASDRRRQAREAREREARPRRLPVP